jgi:hypothetical protein
VRRASQGVPRGAVPCAAGRLPQLQRSRMRAALRITPSAPEGPAHDRVECTPSRAPGTPRRSCSGTAGRTGPVPRALCDAPDDAVETAEHLMSPVVSRLAGVGRRVRGTGAKRYSWSMSEGPYRAAGNRESEEPPPDAARPWALQTWTSRRACPVCGVALYAARKDGFRVDGCGSCGGVWLSHADAEVRSASGTSRPSSSPTSPRELRCLPPCLPARGRVPIAAVSSSI